MKNKISLLFSLFVCILVYGQYIDVTEPPYNVIAGELDSSDKIQMAIDDLNGSQKSATLFIPAGFYKLRKPLVIRHNMEILGAGAHATILQPIRCNGFIIEHSNVALRNLYILGYRAADETGDYTAITSEGKKNEYVRDSNGNFVLKDGKKQLKNNNSIRNLHFESLRIEDFYQGIHLKYTWSSVIDKISTFINSGKNLQIKRGISLYGQSVNNRISNCHLASAGISIGVFLDTTEIVNLDTATFKEIANQTERAEGLMIMNTFMGLGNYGIYSEGILSMNVSNCTIDLIRKMGIYGELTSGLLLSNNWIAVVQQAPRQLHPIIKLVYSGDAHISNNNIRFTDNDGLKKDKIDFTTDSNVGVSLEKSTNTCSIIGNSFGAILYQHRVLTRDENGRPIPNLTIGRDNIVEHNQPRR